MVFCFLFVFKFITYPIPDSKDEELIRCCTTLFARYMKLLKKVVSAPPKLFITPKELIAQERLKLLQPFLFLFCVSPVEKESSLSRSVAKLQAKQHQFQ